MPRTARHPLLLSVASTSSSVPYVATVQPQPLSHVATAKPTSPSIHFVASVQDNLIFYIPYVDNL